MLTALNHEMPMGFTSAKRVLWYPILDVRLVLYSLYLIYNMMNRKLRTVNFYLDCFVTLLGFIFIWLGVGREVTRERFPRDMTWAMMTCT